MSTIDLKVACNSICHLCGEGKPVGFDDLTSRWQHEDQYGFYYNAGWCRADALRKLATPQPNPSKS